MNIEIVEVLLGLVTLIGLAGIFMLAKIGTAKGWFTKDNIVFVDDIIGDIEPLVLVLTDDNEMVVALLAVCEDIVQYANELQATGELDKLELLRFAYSIMEHAGLDLGEKEKSVIESIVNIIYRFI